MVKEYNIMGVNITCRPIHTVDLYKIVHDELGTWYEVVIDGETFITSDNAIEAHKEYQNVVRVCKALH